ncbi:MAG: Uncharacterized MFS-type transporter, partial [uncultured Blastococcus sp.]
VAAHSLQPLRPPVRRPRRALVLPRRLGRAAAGADARPGCGAAGRGGDRQLRPRRSRLGHARAELRHRRPPVGPRHGPPRAGPRAAPGHGRLRAQRRRLRGRGRGGRAPVELVRPRRGRRSLRPQRRLAGARPVVGRPRPRRAADGLRVRGCRRRGGVRRRPAAGHPAGHPHRAAGRLPDRRRVRRGRRPVAGVADRHRAAGAAARPHRAQPAVVGADADVAGRRRHLPGGRHGVRRHRRRGHRVRRGAGRHGALRARAGRLRRGQPGRRPGLRGRAAAGDAGRAVRGHRRGLRARRPGAVAGRLAAGADRLRLPRRPDHRAGPGVRDVAGRVAGGGRGAHRVPRLDHHRADARGHRGVGPGGGRRRRVGSRARLRRPGPGGRVGGAARARRSRAAARSGTPGRAGSPGRGRDPGV